MNDARLIEIDFLRCIKSLWEHIRLILAVTAFSLLAGAILSWFTLERENIYEAVSSVYINADGTAYETAESSQMLVAYIDVIKSLKVAERASILLGNEGMNKYEISEMVNVDYQNNDYATFKSTVIRIRVGSKDSTAAVNVANAVAQAFSLEMASITGKNDVQVLDEANGAIKIYNAKKQLVLVTGLITVGGCILICAMIVLYEIFSFRLNTIKDGTLYGQLDIIGVIPEYEK